MNRISFNGKSINVSENNVSIINGVIIVDGIVVESGLTDQVNIKWEGDLASLNTDSSVTCNNVQGDVKVAGSINCDNVNGSVNAGRSVNCGKVGGNVNAGGSVRIS